MNTLASRADSYPDHLHRSLPVRLPFQWLTTLDRIIEELERLPALTEERFLHVGEHLRTLAGQLRQMEENSSVAGQLMSDDATFAAIREFENVLDRMDSYFHGADRAAVRAGESLAGILGELDTIHRLMKSFKEQVGNLRMLKILTNIQSACHGGHGAGFRNVAADINSLSENVQAKSTAIITRIKWLHGDLESAVSMAGALGKNQKRLGDKVMTAIRHNVASLAGMHANCSGAARDVSGRSAKIARDVGEVVVSLQFQDITRQQMEHVREALVALQERISDGGGIPVTAEEAAEHCALQVAQLVHSSDELSMAMNRVTASLAGISREATIAAANVHGLFRQADLVGHASVSDIENGLATVVTAFAENVATNGRLNDIMRAVTKAMSEINTFAEDIEYLGSEIRLIALNAIIKAAQAGKEGAAFGVIAETVKRQSEDICRQAAAITASIHTITQHVADLQHDLETEAGEGDTESEVESRKEELAVVVARLREVTAAVTAMLARTDEVSDWLAVTIDGALASLGGREIMTTLREDVISRLSHLAATARPGGNGAAGGTNGLAKVERLYTMQSERKVHQLFAASRPDRGTNGTAGSPVGSCRESGDAHWGDNVELF